MEHHFNVDEAVKYGVESAILIYNIRFWIAKNKANKSNFINGKYWTYNSSKAFAELFPYMSDQKIARHLRSLEDMGVIESAILSENKYDKTKWYTLNDGTVNDEYSIVQNLNTDCSNLNNGTFKNEQYISDNKLQIINSDNKLHIIRSGKEVSIFENELEILLEVFKEVTGKNHSNINQLMKNYEHWRNFYTPAQIQEAIMNIRKSKFWKDKMTPVIFFRQKNTAKEPVDYIGDMLNVNSKENIFL